MLLVLFFIHKISALSYARHLSSPKGGGTQHKLHFEKIIPYLHSMDQALPTPSKVTFVGHVNPDVLNLYPIQKGFIHTNISLLGLCDLLTRQAVIDVAKLHVIIPLALHALTL
ncbi:hypothetical protein BDN72DRAFT_907329 [Pluteus cervinus]|uniref:Uncharacterized protein n=1 Tax=Pluteus cervinus TaxID=181527 RepID=A0ACD2ZX76_9AGAR|nr:hypothetical protein BDN72DRAFT_907329 [Pluteus cervinus]